ncbi:MAG: FKBP-type peptidyl-prolyl cis-trans isomerase [Verrucomicrobiales bacterium]|nr:FKBP-type peptidyl-prolyl cis-trans isomerase [Verrucomicrobiales bacterium]
MTAQDAKKPETLSERVSYSYGLMIARQLTDEGVEIDFEQFKAGFQGILDGAESVLSEDEISATFRENREALDAKKAALVQKVLDENAKKDGVTTTDSGLQYEVLNEGDGEKPSATDKVKVHYHGTLTDGTVFDSSVDRGEPISFPLDGVIKGWTEGVQLMPVGSKFRFLIPSELAYGERGSPPVIGPNAPLFFEVELLAIEK